MSAAARLRIVRTEEPGREEARPAPALRRDGLGDVALVAGLFAVNVIPVAGELSGVGRWSPGIVGFAAGALLLTGRELWSQLRARPGRSTDRAGSTP